MFAATQTEVVLRVADRMMRSSIGAIISHGELSAAAGCDIKQHRWLVMRAARLLNKQHGIVFATVRGLGYRRLGGADGVDHAGDRSLTRVRRAARHGTRFLESAMHHANDMSADQRRQANSRLCALGLIQHLSMSRTVKTLPGDQPPPADGLADLRRALSA